MSLESPTTPESSQEEEIELNDFVIWENQGVKQFEEPKRVIRIEEHQGQRFAILEGSMTGVPVEQLKVVFKTN
jgi:hypothetical protein